MNPANETHTRKILRRPFIIGTLVAFVFATISCSTVTAPPAKTTAQRAPSDFTLNVSLYPWVPDRAYFQEVVTAAWAQFPGAPTLVFNQDWDCYSQDPTPALDVFVFDAMFLPYFATSNYLRPYGQ